MSGAWLALLLWAAGGAEGAGADGADGADGARALNVSDRCLADVRVFLRDVSLVPPQHYAALSE